MAADVFLSPTKVEHNITSCKVAAVVVTWNRRALLRQCLNALLGQTRALDNIFVVDNGSDDGTFDILSAEYGEKVSHIRNAENVGCTRAFSQGLLAAYEAGYDWFWLLDDDCLPGDDALERLLSAGSANPRGLYGPRLLEPKTREPISYRWVGATPGSLIEEQSISLGGVLLSREVVASVGYPLCELWVSADDLEYCLRAKRKGHRCFVVYDSVLYHHGYTLFRWGSIKGHAIFAYPKYSSADRAYYAVRNWTFVLLRYWNVLSPVTSMGQLRNMVCLMLSGTISRQLIVRAVKDGFTLQYSLKRATGPSHLGRAGIRGRAGTTPDRMN